MDIRINNCMLAISFSSRMYSKWDIQANNQIKSIWCNNNKLYNNRSTNNTVLLRDIHLSNHNKVFNNTHQIKVATFLNNNIREHLKWVNNLYQLIVQLKDFLQVRKCYKNITNYSWLQVILKTTITPNSTTNLELGVYSSVSWQALFSVGECLLIEKVSRNISFTT